MHMRGFTGKKNHRRLTFHIPHAQCQQEIIPKLLNWQGRLLELHRSTKILCWHKDFCNILTYMPICQCFPDIKDILKCQFCEYVNFSVK